MFEIKGISDIIVIIIFVEFIIMMFLVFRLQSKTKQHEKELNMLSLKNKEQEKQMEAFQKKTNLMEQSIFMQTVRNSKKR